MRSFGGVAGDDGASRRLDILRSSDGRGVGLASFFSAVVMDREA